MDIITSFSHKASELVLNGRCLTVQRCVVLGYAGVLYGKTTKWRQ
ncbi:hypothetical protein [Riemerella anatipestifer]|nr:hypothetical protein [Riemerella anatipestifer]MCQ4156097.1 hypothetical protein [Riemerella anatipestifer]MCQ4181985.1 hypothetical protein [Riemerella anatipestifer]MCU7543187.1 hypothetical protein [Riemerella anatipestifer]MCU7560748.1 hypothetical protein [Riemerella anatipestifer]MCW0519241.1 hypothetical protein [Riemerella anatipestifer]